MKKMISYLLLPAIMLTITACDHPKGEDVFQSQTFIYDGTEKEITLKKVPAGHTVEYENNKATEQGKYKATCKVFDKKNNLVDTYNAILTIDNPENTEFQEYLDASFVEFLGDDYISWNIFAKDPAKFGLTREEENKATWYSYTSLPENYKQENYDIMVSNLEELNEFKNQRLSFSQIKSLDLLIEYVEENIAYYNPEGIYNEMTALHYVDSFGGYAADFPTYIEAYALRSKQDVIDVLSYIESLPEAFATYPTYVNDRLQAGYPLSDYTLDGMITYLKNVTKNKEDYYLVDLLQQKISQCEFLTTEEKTTYSDNVATYFDSYFMPAHEQLITDLTPYKGKCTGKWANYLAAYGEVGKAEYEFTLKSTLGLHNLDLNKYNEYLDENIKKYNDKLNATINRANRLNSSDYALFTRLVNGESVVGIDDPEKMVDYLKDFAKTIVPDLATSPNITIKYMDEATAESSNALAYYMKSALDNDENEYITLNPLTSLDNKNDTLATMAHEGYPGHMYAYMYSKQSDISNLAKIMTNLTHGEGWATYVSLKLYDYIRNHNAFENNKNVVSILCDYMYCVDILSYLAYTKIDYMIHMQNKTVGQVSTFLNSIGFNGDAAQEIFSTLVEIPANYAAYGFGRVFFLDLHLYAEETLGEYYSEKDFNAALLSSGWCSLDRLIDIAEEYIDHTAFVNGLAIAEA